MNPQKNLKRGFFPSNTLLSGILAIFFFLLPDCSFAELYYRVESINLPTASIDRQIQIKVFGKFNDAPLRDIQAFQIRLRFQPNDPITSQSHLVFDGVDLPLEIQTLVDNTDFHINTWVLEDVDGNGWRGIRGTSFVYPKIGSSLPPLTLDTEKHLITVKFTMKGGIPTGTTKKIELADSIGPNGNLPPAENLLTVNGFTVRVTNQFSGTLLVGLPDGTPPTTPQGLQASVAAPTIVDLSWQPSTDNIQVEGYRIYRRDTTNITDQEIGNTPFLLYQDGGLTPDTAYTYTVRAYDAAQNLSSPSSPVSVTPTNGSVDTVKPTPPANLRARPLSSSEVELIWDPATDNVGVKEYKIYRITPPNGLGPFPFLATTLNAPFIDGTINLGTALGISFTYYVTAVDAAGNESDYSNIVPVTVTQASPQPPGVPQNFTANVVSVAPPQVNLSWSPGDTNITVHYRLFRDGKFLAILGGTDTSLSDTTGLVVNTKYDYTVVAYDANEQPSLPAGPLSVTITLMDTLAPTAPRGFRLR